MSDRDRSYRISFQISRASDRRLWDMVRERIAADIDKQADKLERVDVFRHLALTYLETNEAAPDDPAVSIELNGSSPLLMAALRASGETDPDAALSAVSRAFLAENVELPSGDDCGHLEDYQTEDGCLRCFDEQHRGEDRELVADLVDDEGATPA